MQPALILRTLERSGLLLQQDKTLPSVVGLIAGGPLSSSWWSHPRAQEIFQTLEKLNDHPDVLPTRIVAGKVTYLHRRLWPAFLALATSRERWQLEGLTSAARRLFKEIETGRVTQASGKPAKDLQERLLVHAREVHTESGRHEVRLEPWVVWLTQVGRVVRLSATEGREILEQATIAIGAKLRTLPWHRFEKRVMSD